MCIRDRHGCGRPGSRQHDGVHASAHVRHLPAHPREVRARRARAHAGGRDPEDERRRGGPAADQGSRAAARGDVCGRRRVRSGDDPGAHYVREAESGIDRCARGVRERRGGRSRWEAHGSKTGARGARSRMARHRGKGAVIGRYIVKQEQVMSHKRGPRSSRRTPMPLIAACLIAVFALLGGGTAARAQGVQTGSIVGRVTDSATATGITSATVQLDGTRYGAVADQEGRYRIAGVPAGTYGIVARRIGYAPRQLSVTVTAGQETTVDFALRASTRSLDEVIVTGTVAGQE